MNLKILFIFTICIIVFAIIFYSYSHTDKSYEQINSRQQENSLQKKAELNESTPLPVLISMLQEKEPSIHTNAQNLLIRKGPESIPALLPLLIGNDPVFAQRVGRVLGEIGDVSSKPLLEIVDNEKLDISIRIRALDAFVFMGKKAEPVIPKLIARLQIQSNKVRDRLIEVLSYLGQNIPSTPPLLIQACSSPSDRLKKGAIRSLSRMGKHAFPAIPTIVKMLGKGSSPDVKTEAGWALKSLNTTPDVVAELMKAAETSSYPLKENAIRIAGMMGRNAIPAIPIMIKSLGDKRYQVVNSAHSALSTLGKEMPDLVVPELQKLLSHEQPEIIDRAKLILEKIQGKANEQK